MNTPSATAVRLHHAAESLLYTGPHRDLPLAPLAFGIILDGLRGAEEIERAAPKDATIAALAEEVELLAEGLRFYQPAIVRKAERERAIARLRRLGLALGILLLGTSLYAAPVPHKPRHVTKPISTITVKVVSQVDFLRGAPAGGRGSWRITTADIDGCTAWVDDSAPDVTAAEILALRACRMKIDLAVDAAHAAAEKGGPK